MRSVVFLAALIPVFGTVASCGSTIDCTVRHDCPSDLIGRAGSGGGAGVSEAAGAAGDAQAGEPSDGGSAGSEEVGCDKTGDPATSACVIQDEFGLFVAPDGNDDDADGSAAKPFATLSKALSAISADTPQRLYVCAAGYVEPDTLRIPNGVSIYGGFSCDAGRWAYDAPVPAVIEPASPIGAIIEAATLGVTLQDLRIDAQDAETNGAGASSYGIVITDSTSVVLRRVEIRAGKGSAGSAGVDATDPGPPPQTKEPKSSGRDATCNIAPPTAPIGGLAAMQIACANYGGNGGLGYGSFSARGGAGVPGSIDNAGAAATTTGQTFPGSSGIDGAPGEDAPAVTRADAVGTFSATGYVPASGADGVQGLPGQGGGGGGASLGNPQCTGAGGGAGGRGGCGAPGGAGGQGGGASVAVFAWKSALTLDSCHLVAEAGGAGGNGGNSMIAAELGLPGANGGLGAGGVASGGKGGAGGVGGLASGAGGGSGGPSLALVYAGTEPTLLNHPSLLPGAAGAAGSGGAAQKPGLRGPEGRKGTSQAEYAAE